MRKLIFFVCFLVLSNLEISKAETGCLIGSKIYYNQSTSVYNPYVGGFERFRYSNSMNDSYDSFSGVCSPGDYNNYAIKGSQVYVYGFVAIDCGFSGDSWDNADRGKVFNFTIANCPLDDYVITLIILVACIGFYRIGRQTLVFI